MNISPMRIKVDLQHWCLIANQALFHQFKNYPTSISLTAEVYKTKVKLSLSPIQNLQVKEEKTPACSFKFKHLTWETEDLCIFCLIHVNLTCQNCRVFFRGMRAWGTSCTLRTSVECPKSDWTSAQHWTSCKNQRNHKIKVLRWLSFSCIYYNNMHMYL